MASSDATTALKRRGIGCLAFAMVIVIGLLLAVQACRVADAHPTDDAMRSEFLRQHVQFETLRQMVASEQRVTRIAPDFIRIDNMQPVPADKQSDYLTPKRSAAYRAMFNTLNLESGVDRYQNGAIAFYRSSRGLVTSGSAKSYLWDPSYAGLTLSADDPRTLEDACTPKSGCEVARKIAPNWYIIYERH